MLTRRQALLTLAAVPVVAATTLPVMADEGARFEVIYVDPQGSGMDWQGHLGRVVTRGRRCCENCSIIVATLGHPDNKWEVLFTRSELKPLNAEAEDVLAAIGAHGTRFNVMPEGTCAECEIGGGADHADFCEYYNGFRVTREMFRRVLPDGSFSEHTIWAEAFAVYGTLISKNVDYARLTETWERPRGIDHLEFTEIRAKMRLVKRVDHKERFRVVTRISAEALEDLGMNGNALVAHYQNDPRGRVILHPEDWTYTALLRRT